MNNDKPKKIAISGKGGVGKSTLAAALSLLVAERNISVLAMDADPDANLGSALGIPLEEQKNIVTIARHKALIEERTGAEVQKYGQMFKLNPEVSDIAEKYAYKHRGVNLLVIGAIQSGGGGCACPENVLLQALVQNIILHRNEIMIMDMEPGVEHLGRATVQGVDSFIIVVEPGQRSIESYKRISRMAGEIGLKKLYAVANKVKSADDMKLIKDSLPDADIIGAIPWSENLRMSDRDGRSVLDGLDPETKSEFVNILNKLQIV